MAYQLTITGQFTDPLGVGVSGAALWFTAKQSSRGSSHVLKGVDAYAITDASGFYSFGLASGFYAVECQEPTDLAPRLLGAANVSGVGSIDLGTLLGQSEPPPSELEQIGDVVVSGRANGSILVWNASQRKWTTPLTTGQFATAEELGRRVYAIHHDTTATGNAAGITSNLMSATIPANTLADNRDSLRITSAFTTTGTYALTAEKRIQAYLGSTLVYDVYVLNANARPVNVTAEFVVTRTGSNLVSSFASTRHDEYSPPPYYIEPAFTGAALNLASAQTFRFSASGMNARDVVQREMLLEFIPAP